MAATVENFEEEDLGGVAEKCFACSCTGRRQVAAQNILLDDEMHAIIVNRAFSDRGWRHWALQTGGQLKLRATR